MIAARLGLHGDLAPRSPSIRTRPTRFAAGAQTRKRTDPSGNPTAPARRAGPPCLVSSFMGMPLRFGPPFNPAGPARPIRTGQPTPAVAPPFNRRPPARPRRLATRRDGRPPGRPRAARAASSVVRGAGYEQAHEQAEWPQTGQKTAFRKRPPHRTHWHVSVLRGSFIAVRPSHAAGEAPAGEGRVPSRGRGPIRRRRASPTADSFHVTFIPCPDPRRTGRVDTVSRPDARDEPEKSSKFRWTRSPGADGLPAAVFSILYARRMPISGRGVPPGDRAGRSPGHWPSPRNLNVRPPNRSK